MNNEVEFIYIKMFKKVPFLYTTSKGYKEAHDLVWLGFFI